MTSDTRSPLLARGALPRLDYAVLVGLKNNRTLGKLAGQFIKVQHGYAIRRTDGCSMTIATAFAFVFATGHRDRINLHSKICEIRKSTQRVKTPPRQSRFLNSQRPYFGKGAHQERHSLICCGLIWLDECDRPHSEEDRSDCPIATPPHTFHASDLAVHCKEKITKRKAPAKTAAFVRLRVMIFAMIRSFGDSFLSRTLHFTDNAAPM
jgi:hypothetical protein